MSDYDPNRPPAPPWQAGSGQQRAPVPQQGWQQPAAPSASVQTTMHEMTEQLQTVIDAAERAADAIRHDAEDQARQHMIDAQRRADQLTAERVGLISDLTDDLIRHAETVKQHSEQMVRALEDAITSVTGKLDQPGFHQPLSAPSAGYGDFTTTGAPAGAGYEPPAPQPPGEQAYEPPPAPDEPAYPPPPAYDPRAHQPLPAAPPWAPAPTGQPAPIPPPPSERPPSEGPTEEDEENVFRPGSY